MITLRGSRVVCFCLVSVSLLAACGSTPAPSEPAGIGGPDPAQAVEGLLLADRTFSAVSADVDLVSGLTAMFDEDVIMAVPGQPFARGKSAARAALESNPSNLESRASWTPIRGGVSADGLHGFTLGYMTTTRADGSGTPGKYLSYWVRRPDGWRVAVYRRSPRPEGDVPAGMLPPALPPRMTTPATDDSLVSAYRDELDRAEREFSDDAQLMGLGPAFARHGSADATHLGGPADVEFVVGADAIARSVSANQPEGAGSTLSWTPEQVLVASSGDLGVTIGLIVQNADPDQKRGPGFPFFTIWRRAAPGEPWRYVAE